MGMNKIVSTLILLNKKYFLPIKKASIYFVFSVARTLSSQLVRKIHEERSGENKRFLPKIPCQKSIIDEALHYFRSITMPAILMSSIHDSITNKKELA